MEGWTQMNTDSQDFNIKNDSVTTKHGEKVVKIFDGITG